MAHGKSDAFDSLGFITPYYSIVLCYYVFSLRLGLEGLSALQFWFH